QGTFALVKAFNRGENSWLLMKVDDEFSSKKDILKKNKSVLSGKDQDQITATSDNIYGQQQPKTRSDDTDERKPASKKSIKKRKEKHVAPDNPEVPQPHVKIP